jgi:hypothetical protein
VFPIAPVFIAALDAAAYAAAVSADHVLFAIAPALAAAEFACAKCVCYGSSLIVNV